ncbi:YggT family protein [Endozoicomonas ascidiicola]|uniref:YggT family protein n=1 Tax=Endozoicomonas ascidiicola TaxID=1698521 RepID=UPI0008329DE3|nr:YggT family protein [Endozoicomonas ascidiicola]
MGALSSGLTSSLSFLIQTLGGLYIMAVLVRFLLQLVRADFYNPISQAIVKATSPLLTPIRKVIPGYAGIDFASLVLALVLQIILLFVDAALKGHVPTLTDIPDALFLSTIQIAISFLKIYLYSLIIIAIASWVAPGSYNPGLMLLHQITEPLTKRVRAFIPPLGGLDFSLMLLVIIIMSLLRFLGA